MASTSSYLKLSFNTSDTLAEAMADYLTDVGALSVSMKNAGDEKLFQLEPHETPLWNEVHVEALFPAKTAVEPLFSDMKNVLALDTLPPHTLEALVDQDWVRKTQSNFQPQCYGKTLWVCPSFHDADALKGTVVKIDPGLAFGTGTHETTSLCLQWLAENPPMNKTVIDYGCGSGILALAALALGASNVIATDHDTQAVEATNNNAALNAFVDNKNLTIVTPAEMPEVKADLMIANILANPLIELAPLLTALTAHNGTLILSGILTPESKRVLEAYKNHFELLDETHNGEWVRLVLSKIP